MNVFEYLQWAEGELMRLGNHVSDRLVFGYLLARMDADSGVVGKRSTLARGRIALDISDKGGRGTRKALLEFSADDVDNSIRRMCKAGMMDKLTVPHGNLVVKFIFPTENMTSPFSNQNEVTTKSRRSYDTKTLINKYSYAEQKPSGYDEVTTILPSIHPSTQEGFLADKKFCMFQDWQPSVDMKKKVSKMVNITPELMVSINLKVLEYALYWSLPDNQRTVKTQGEWELHFLRNEIGRVIRGDVIRQAPAPMQQPRKALVVPNMQGGDIQGWARRNGLPDALPGEEDWQYVGRLRALAERLNDANSKGVH